MQSIPKKLYERASSLGFTCYTHDDRHFIHPQESKGWYLTYQQGYWVLVVKDVPQMNLCPEEVVKFLDRVAAAGFRSMDRAVSTVSRNAWSQRLS